MLINHHRPSRLARTPRPQKQESVTLASDESWRKSETFEKVTHGAAQLGGLAAGVGSGIYASTLLSSNLNGLAGAVTGVITGAVTGGVTGFGVAEVTKRALNLDRYGDSMMKLVSLSAGTVGGAIAGGISGYMGAQPLVVAPAAVAGGLVGTMALHAAQRAITR